VHRLSDLLGDGKSRAVGTAEKQEKALMKSLARISFFASITFLVFVLIATALT
jgi:hypothetical protein